MTQLPLLTASKAPRVSEGDVQWLIRVLDGKGWISARDLAWCRQGSDRKLRAIAAASEGQIISGQKGYCLTSQASVEDVNHAMAWMRSQAKSMSTRANEIQQVLNGRLVRSA